MPRCCKGGTWLRIDKYGEGNQFSGANSGGTYVQIPKINVYRLYGLSMNILIIWLYSAVLYSH